jgi:YhcH/YjgK/YiaL family protein
MIFNQLEETNRLCNLHPGFSKALEFLKRSDLASLAAGTYELEGKNIYAMVQKGIGQGKTSARLEIHREYIDIQFTLKGLELIGCGYARNHQPDAQGWDFAKDVCFLSGAPDFWLPIPAGSLAVFYPEEDLHAPMCGDGEVRKVVIKVRA